MISNPHFQASNLCCAPCVRTMDSYALLVSMSSYQIAIRVALIASPENKTSQSIPILIPGNIGMVADWIKQHNFSYSSAYSIAMQMRPRGYDFAWQKFESMSLICFNEFPFCISICKWPTQNVCVVNFLISDEVLASACSLKQVLIKQNNYSFKIPIRFQNQELINSPPYAYTCLFSDVGIVILISHLCLDLLWSRFPKSPSSCK